MRVKIIDTAKPFPKPLGRGETMIKRVIFGCLLTAALPVTPVYSQQALLPVTAAQEDGKIILTLPRQDDEGVAGQDDQDGESDPPTTPHLPHASLPVANSFSLTD